MAAMAAFVALTSRRSRAAPSKTARWRSARASAHEALEEKPSAEATKRWLRTKWVETGYRPEAITVAAPSPKVAASPAAPSPTFVGELL